MAKVGISMEDELLAKFDARADELGTSRSAVIRDCARDGLTVDDLLAQSDLELRGRSREAWVRQAIIDKLNREEAL